jgi:hypothetical protein
LLVLLEALEFLCDCCTAEGGDVEVLGCLEVLHGLLEVLCVFGGVGDGELVAFHLVGCVRGSVGLRSLLNGSSDRCSGEVVADLSAISRVRVNTLDTHGFLP